MFRNEKNSRNSALATLFTLHSSLFTYLTTCTFLKNTPLAVLIFTT
jgi:hypothetical protein